MIKEIEIIDLTEEEIPQEELKMENCETCKMGDYNFNSIENLELEGEPEFIEVAPNIHEITFTSTTERLEMQDREIMEVEYTPTPITYDCPENGCDYSFRKLGIVKLHIEDCHGYNLEDQEKYYWHAPIPRFKNCVQYCENCKTGDYFKKIFLHKRSQCIW